MFKQCIAMTKALLDQSGDLNKLRSFLDDESSIKESMDQLLNEMRKLIVTFNSDIES